MNLKLPVLAVSITSLHEARFFAGMGVELLSFEGKEVLDENFKTIETLRNWLSISHMFVELQDYNPELAEKELIEGQLVPFEKAQHHSVPIFGTITQPKGFNQSILVVQLTAADLTRLEEVLTELCKDYKVFLLGNWTTKDIPALLASGAFGIALHGKTQELKVGLNEFSEDIADLLEELETED